MKKVIALLVLLLAAFGASAQQARVFAQPELDALLAPIALYPDTVVSQVLIASTMPDQVAQAAAWSRANPQISGDVAVGAAQQYGWHPAVAGLTAYPDLLARMQESPQWVYDLGQAYVAQGPQVMDTVQQLRMRAQASGYLRSDAQQQVYSDAGRIVVQPAYTNVVYLPYYNPLIVYGSWWWPAYRPVYWRPWSVRPAYYAWHPAYSWRPHNRVAAPPISAQIRAEQRTVERHAVSRPYVPVPEAARRPIVQSAPHMPPAASFSQHPRAPHVERREAGEHHRGNRRG